MSGRARPRPARGKPDALRSPLRFTPRVHDFGWTMPAGTGPPPGPCRRARAHPRDTRRGVGYPGKGSSPRTVPTLMQCTRRKQRGFNASGVPPRLPNPVEGGGRGGVSEAGEPDDSFPGARSSKSCSGGVLGHASTGIIRWPLSGTWAASAAQRCRTDPAVHAWALGGLSGAGLWPPEQSS